MSVDSDIGRLILASRDGTRLPVGSRSESWVYEGSMTAEVPHYTVTVGDADEELRRSGVLDRQADEKLDRGVTCVIDGLRWELRSVRPQGATVDLIVEPYFVCRLRRRDTARVFRRGAYTRAGALRTLVVTEEPEVTFVCPARGEKRAADRERDATAKAAKASRAGGASGIPKDAKLTVKGAAASEEQREVGELVLEVCAEEDAGPKATKAAFLAGIVESELQNLPGGDRDSRGVIQIRDGTARGVGVDNRDVSDSIRAFLNKGFYSKYADGKAIPTGRGGGIDVAHDRPTFTAGQVAQSVQGSGVPDAYDRWSKEADEWIDAFDGTGDGTPSPSRAAGDTARDEWRRGGIDGEREDTLAMGRRLGDEVRWAWFPTLDTEVVYADERDLIRARAAATLRPHDGAVDFIDGGWDAGHDIDTLTVEVRGLRPRDIPHGAPVIVEDAGENNGRYLVESVRVSSSDEAGTLTLRRARDPKREPVVEQEDPDTGSTRRSSRPAARSTRQRIVDEAVKTLTVKDNGAPGTGHRRYSWTSPPANLTDPTPATGRTDCSQWIAAIYAKAQAGFPGGTTYEMNAKCRRTAKPLPGDIMLTRDLHHCELYVGSGNWKGNIIGHGSEPIDRDSTANWPGHFFVTLLGDGDDLTSDTVGETPLGQGGNLDGRR